MEETEITSNNNIDSDENSKPTVEAKATENETHKLSYLNPSNIRTYLEKKVLQILKCGLEELLKEANNFEKRKESGEENVPEIQPLYFLARYLMQNSESDSRN